MTLQQLLQPIAVPSRPQGTASNGNAAFFAVGVIDANDEKVAFVVLLQKAGDISTVHFRTGTVTTGDDVLVRLETVDQTTGNPTGTLWGTTTSATVTVADGDDDNCPEIVATGILGIISLVPVDLVMAGATIL